MTIMGTMDRDSVTIPGKTITELITYWGTSPGKDGPAFVSVDSCGRKRQLTRNDVYILASRFADKLRLCGAGKGKIVCNALPNSVERIVCEFGIIFSGATSMNGQIFRTDGEDFFDALRTSQCSLVIVDPNVPKGARQLLLKEVPAGFEDCVASKSLPHLQKILICGRDDNDSNKDFISSLRDPQLPVFKAQVLPSDVANVMTTSGSTGYSKLVQLTHSNICHFGIQVKGIEPFVSGERFINCAPLGWAGGYPQWYLSCGVTRYFVDLHDGPVKDLPATIWKTIVNEKIAYGFLSPMYVNEILDNKSLWEGVSWKPRTLCLAGQPVKKPQMQIIGKLCSNVDINYGITECNLVTTHRILDPDQFTDGCAGYPGYGVDIKIVDKDKKVLPQGVTGEILLKSPSLCVGYLNNDTAYNSSFTNDGWFCTDDAGYIGEDRKLYVEGRQSDSILRGAYILYPGWLEKKLKEVPGVRDVVVVPVPDPVLHNEICACVLADGITGVVPGLFHDHLDSGASHREKQDLDDVDNISFKKFENTTLDVGSKMEKDTFIGFGMAESYATPQQLEEIRTQGLAKPLSISFNVTKSKMVDVESPQSSANQSTVKTVEPWERGVNSADTVELERRLRQQADSFEVLSKKDAMRMVPKYYVFVDKFPLTNTFKVSRKEIRKIAKDAIGL